MPTSAGKIAYSGSLDSGTCTDGRLTSLLFCGTLNGVTKYNQNDDIGWDSRREGYLQSSNKFVPVVAIPKAAKKKQSPSEGTLVSVRTEERLGSLLAASGTAWLVYAATTDLAHIWQMRVMQVGPVEVCVLGILLWIHGKWRRSIKLD